jgi:hypothetical protein
MVAVVMVIEMMAIRVIIMVVSAVMTLQMQIDQGILVSEYRS